MGIPIPLPLPYQLDMQQLSWTWLREFRKKMAFFTTMPTFVPHIGSLPGTGSAVSTNFTDDNEPPTNHQGYDIFPVVKLRHQLDDASNTRLVPTMSAADTDTQVLMMKRTNSDLSNRRLDLGQDNGWTLWATMWLQVFSLILLKFKAESIYTKEYRLEWSQCFIFGLS